MHSSDQGLPQNKDDSLEGFFSLLFSSSLQSEKFFFSSPRFVSGSYLLESDTGRP